MAFARTASVSMMLFVSFFILYLIAYTVDRSTGRLRTQFRNREVLIYVILLPALIAGVVIRPEEFIRQWRKKYALTDIDWVQFTGRMLRGSFERFVVGGLLLSYILIGLSDPSQYQGLSLLLLIVLILPALYFEILGTTRMAQAVGLLLGLDLPSNFDAPWRSRNLVEFWQRWHITVSQWVRDYVFFALLSTRLSRMGTSVLLILSFGTFGLWHGLAFKFLLWGLWHGSMLVLTRKLSLLRNGHRFMQGFIYVFIISVPALALLATDLAHVMTIISNALSFSAESLIGLTRLRLQNRIEPWIVFGFVMLAASFESIRGRARLAQIEQAYRRWPYFLQAAVAVIGFLIVLAFAATDQRVYFYSRF